MPRCAACGSAHEQGANFCPTCGRALAPVVAEPERSAAADRPPAPSRLERWRNRRRQNSTIALWRARGVKHPRLKLGAIIVVPVGLLLLIVAGAMFSELGAGTTQAPAVEQPAPPDVQRAFASAIDASLKNVSFGPPVVAVSGTSVGWDVTVMDDLSRGPTFGPMLTAEAALGDYAYVAYSVFHVGLPTRMLRYSATTAVRDIYGNTLRETFIQVTIPGATAAKVNWSNEDIPAFLALSQITWLDTAFEQGYLQCGSPYCPNMPADFHDLISTRGGSGQNQ